VSAVPAVIRRAWTVPSPQPAAARRADGDRCGAGAALAGELPQLLFQAVAQPAG
jgi:hypothetical protein